MVIDKVEEAQHEGYSSGEESDASMSSTKESEDDETMEDESEEHLTLGKFQECLRREVLVRKLDQV